MDTKKKKLELKDAAATYLVERHTLQEELAGSVTWVAPDAWEYPDFVELSSNPLVMPAGQFKAHCLQLLEQVARGEEIMVTKRGRAVALLIPPPVTRLSRMDLRGSVTYKDEADLLAPTNEAWPGEND